MDAPVYVPGQRLRVEFYKYPGRQLHYWWEAEVAEVRQAAHGGREPAGVLVYAPVGHEFHHESKGLVVRVGHQACVAFFPGRWYSGGPHLDGDGRVVEYYWNVQTPPTFEPARIWQYDLELDVQCTADRTCEVCDLEEFEARRRVYPPGWVEAALQAVEEIQAHVRVARWPVLRQASSPTRCGCPPGK